MAYQNFRWTASERVVQNIAWARARGLCSAVHVQALLEVWEAWDASLLHIIFRSLNRIKHIEKNIKSQVNQVKRIWHLFACLYRFQPHRPYKTHQDLVWFRMFLMVSDFWLYFDCQIAGFVDAQNLGRLASGEKIYRFADLYHSAHRTPVSTEDVPGLSSGLGKQ